MPSRPSLHFPLFLMLLAITGGCVGVENPEARTTTTAPQAAHTPSSTTATVSTTTTETTPRTSVLTDRTPTTRLELHPALDFTGRLVVHLNGDEVFNQTVTEDDWTPEIDLSDEFHDDAGYRVRVTAITENESTVWERGVGETEGYELEILENSTIQVEMRIVG